MVQYKKIRILLIGLIAISFSLNAQTWPPTGIAGDGSNSSPWQLTTAEHLNALAYFVRAGNGDATNGKYYKLMNNIDLSGYADGEGWQPIGYYYSEYGTAINFQGTFDGNGMAVQNLIINNPEASSIGLFGYTYNATIKNLGVENCSIYAYSDIGGLVGNTDNSIISNCYVTGSIAGIRSNYVTFVGGLVGINDYNSQILNCYTTCNVSGKQSYIGGLVGVNLRDAIISNCYATGTISGNTLNGGTGENIGGLVGSNHTNATITNSYATGSIIAAYGRYLGGLVGANESIISNCYSTSFVAGNSYIGGLSGTNSGENAVISNCYATGNVGGSDYLGGLIGKNYNKGIIRDCVAANISLTSNSETSKINRITGFNDAFCYNNYAYNDMAVKNNNGDLPIIDGSSEAGISKEMETLKTRNFYTSANNWYNTAWNFIDVWNISEGETLPFFQWGSMSINDYGITQKLTVYPNPTHDILLVDCKNGSKIILYDMLGKEVLTQTANGSTEINVNTLPKGIYCVCVLSEEKIIGINKIVKQ
jgi:hypothetical protein